MSRARARPQATIRQDLWGLSLITALLLYLRIKKHPARVGDLLLQVLHNLLGKSWHFNISQFMEKNRLMIDEQTICLNLPCTNESHWKSLKNTTEKLPCGQIYVLEKSLVAIWRVY
jgi:hypothetical protein